MKRMFDGARTSRLLETERLQTLSTLTRTAIAFLLAPSAGRRIRRFSSRTTYCGTRRVDRFSAMRITDMGSVSYRARAGTTSWRWDRRRGQFWPRLKGPFSDYGTWHAYTLARSTHRARRRARPSRWMATRRRLSMTSRVNTRRQSSALSSSEASRTRITTRRITLAR